MGSRVDRWTGCGCISELASEHVRQTLLKKTGLFLFLTSLTDVLSYYFFLRLFEVS